MDEEDLHEIKEGNYYQLVGLEGFGLTFPIIDPDAAVEVDTYSYLRPHATQHTIDLTLPTDDEAHLSEADALVVVESSFSHEKMLSCDPWSASTLGDF